MELLKNLFAIHSPSGNEVKIRKYIKKWVNRNVPGCRIKCDMYGNMYITKGDAAAYPCAVAHLDQVQKPYPADYMVIESDDVIFAYSHSMRSQCGLGADDKCGIWIALNLLKRYDNVKVAFFAAEEIGCKGSSKANMAFFDDTMFIIEADRRGSSDLITEIGYGPICSDEFVKAIQPELFGYKKEHGLMTDVEALRSNGYPNSCINFSCGYYNPHSNEEFVDKNDLLNAYAFACHIFDTITESQPFDDSVYWKDYDNYGYGSYAYTYDDFYDQAWQILDSYGDVAMSIDDKSLVEDLKCFFTQVTDDDLSEVVADWKHYNK